MRNSSSRPDHAAKASSGPRTAWLAAVLAAAAATGVAALIEPSMSVAGLAMVYFAASALAAMALPRAPAVLASVLCVTSLDFFFVPPRLSFAVQGSEYWWTLAVLLGISLALNVMVARLRTRTAQAETERQRASQLHALGEALALHSGHEAMAEHAAHHLHDVLGLPCAIFFRGEAAGTTLHCAMPPEARFQLAPADWAIDNGRAIGRGCPDWPDLPLWCAPLARHGASGAIQVLLGSADRPPPDTLQHWQALVSQAGLAIERERAATIARAAQDSAQSEAARNTLLASLSHDLRTPLAAIEGTASALRMQGGSMTSAQQARLLANLENEARDLTLMADNILQMARLSQVQWRLRSQWESVDDILAAAAARMRRRWDHAAIRLRVAPDLPPLQAEAGLLAQVIANLVDNAVRHGGHDSEAPQVTLQAGRSRDGLFIAVRDQGRGLPEGDAATLFDRWKQGSARPGGTGLGLALCRLIVEAHGGTIEAKRCEPGTEIRIDLPVAAPPKELA